MKKINLLVVLGILLSCNVYAQLQVTTNSNAQDLAQTLTGNGVVISNATVVCPNGAIGTFTNGNTTNLGVNDGVVLTSGQIIDIPNDNAVFAGTDNLAAGDADLDAVLTQQGLTSQDGCVLEFDVQVLGDTLQFNYVFGSEEYDEFVCSNFNDIFSFFVTGPNPLGGTYTSQNIALIPGTSLPVSISSVNNGSPGASAGGGTCNLTNQSLAYSQYFISNTGSTIVYDGFTTVLRAFIPAVPCQTYRLKLALADAGDGGFDSGVMLQARSFTATNVVIQPGTQANQFFVNGVEGCNATGFRLVLNNVLNDPYLIRYQLGGQAQNGIDYPTQGDSVIIAPGDSVAIIPIDPIFDGLNEGVESVKLYLLNFCTQQPYDSAVLFIQDTVEIVTTSPDLQICRGESTTLFASGGQSFIWTPGTGLSSTTDATVTASPTQTITYNVTAFVGACSDDKDITVTVIDPLFSIDAGPDDTICRYGTSAIDLTVTGNQAPYTYLWSPDSTLSNGAAEDPIAQPDQTTTYNVVVTGANGCTLRDSLRVFIIGQGPYVVINADKNNVCLGDTINLQASIFPRSCGLNVIPCNGNFGINGLGTGTQAFGPSPYSGNNDDSRMQILYRASELQAMGMSSSTITDIGFDVAFLGSGSTTYNDFTIKMGCTDVNELSEFVPGLSVVSPPAPYQVVSTGINNHNLSTPYDWDGYSNLIIEICYDNTGFLFPGNDDVNSTPTGYNSVIQATAFDDVGCNLGNNSFPFLTGDRPNTQFVYCTEVPPVYSYAWNPTAGLVNPDSLNPQAVISQNITYAIAVSDSLCESGAFINLNVAGYGINAGNDTVVCNGNSVQLNALPTGQVPGGPLNCGFNGTQCSGPATEYELTGNAFLNSNPFDQFFVQDVRSQFLYKAADLINAGMSVGVISSLSFNVLNKGTILPYSNFSVSIACTNKEDLDLVGWEPATTVYASPAFNTAVGWNSIPFSSNFDWDGSSNIIVGICWDNDDAAPIFGGTDDVSASSKGYTASNLATGSFEIGCSMDIINAFPGNTLPNLRFNVCPGPPLQPTISWTPTATLNNPNIPNPIATPTQPSTDYIVTAAFAGGCTWFDTVNVGTGTLVYTLSNDTAFCLGNDAQLNVTGAGVTATWANVPGLSCYNCTNPVANPTVDTQYPVSLTNAQGCALTDTVSIDITSEFTNYTLSGDSVLCAGNAVQLNIAGADSVQWANIPGLSCYDCPNPFASPSDTTTYTVRVANADGCFNFDTIVLYVREMDAFVLFNDTLIDQGTNITLYADATGGYGTYNYTWTPAANLDNANIQNPTANTVIQETVYYVNVTSGDCVDNDSVRVRVNIIESPIALPNAFTPNGDGLNEGFFPYIPQGSLAQVAEFRVYNRWGEIIHEGNTPWKGDYKGKDQPTGTYQYYLIVRRPFVADQVVQGNVTLIR